MVRVSSDWLETLSDEQLIAYADQGHGIRLPLGTPRTQIISKIVAAAIAARDVP